MVITRWKWGSGEVEKGKEGVNYDGDLTWGDENTIQYTDDVL